MALSHKFPDGNFEQVVREAFKLVLERDRKRKALTDRPRVPTDEPRVSTGEPPAPTIRPSAPTGQPAAPIELSRPPSDARRHSGIPAASDRYVRAAVKRAVWERDHARCTWPMGDGEICGARHQLELDHDLEVALGGKPTIENIRLLCRSHNLMKAERHLGRAFMARFRKSCSKNCSERDTS